MVGHFLQIEAESIGENADARNGVQAVGLERGFGGDEGGHRLFALRDLLFQELHQTPGLLKAEFVLVVGGTGDRRRPSFSTTLAFCDGLRSERLAASLLPAQRDYFGAHTYERVDQPRGQFFHTNWTGRGGTTASSTYTV